MEMFCYLFFLRSKSPVKCEFLSVVALLRLSDNHFSVMYNLYNPEGFDVALALVERSAINYKHCFTNRFYSYCHATKCTYFRKHPSFITQALDTVCVWVLCLVIFIINYFIKFIENLPESNEHLNVLIFVFPTSFFGRHVDKSLKQPIPIL